MRTITVLALLVISAIWPATARAATPEPSPSATATRTPAVTATPAVAASAVATRQATSTASPTAAPASAAFTVSGRLVVDANANGVADGGDGAPTLALLVLVPWSTADALLSPATFDQFVAVRLYSAPDGSFAFEKLPPGSYTLQVFWPTGFVTKGASPAVPIWLRAAFSVTDTGEIVAPNPLPKVWPGSLEPFVPDEPILGRIPDTLVLNKNPNFATVPVEDATGGSPPVGRVDVSAVLRGKQQQQGAVQLPSTGVASFQDGGWLSYVLGAGAALAMVGLAAAIVRRARD